MGFMLGSTCNACCSPSGCSCTAGALPATVTVSFNNKNGVKTQGPNLLPLRFSSCFGSGASGYADAPGGDPEEDIGALTGIAVTDGGSGYAQLGRVAPTLTISNASEEAAVASIVLTKKADKCGVDFWSVTGLTITSGGCGYTDGEEVSLTAAEGDSVQESVNATLQTTRAVPSLSASASPGSGAVFSLSIASNDDDPETWGVTKVTWTGTTSGYSDYSALSFSGLGVVADFEAQVYLRTVRAEPTLSAVAGGTGSGASLSILLDETTDPYEWFISRAAWSVSAISIGDGGAGYSEFDPIDITIVDGKASLGFAFASAYVSAVDEDGAITEITIADGGAYFKDTGVIDLIDIQYGGNYYKGGILSGLSINLGGVYYREDASSPPYVAEVDVSVQQLLPGEGEGAELIPIVDDDPESSTFGKISGVSIADSGDNYLSFQWLYSCSCDAPTVVLKQDDNDPCLYWHGLCLGQDYTASPTELAKQPLVRLEITSATYGTLVATNVIGPGGIPGRDNGPLGFINSSGQLVDEWTPNLISFAWIEDKKVVTDTVTLKLLQEPPSDGSGAVLQAIIDTDPDSATFGRMRVKILDRGDGYLIRSGMFRNSVTFRYGGPTGPHVVTVKQGGYVSLFPSVTSEIGSCLYSLDSSEEVGDCSELTLTAEFGDGTATVTAGGEYDYGKRMSNKCCGYCYVCCPDRDSIEQVVIHFERPASSGDTNGSYNVTCAELDKEVIVDIEDLVDNLHCGEIGPIVETVGSTLTPPSPGFLINNQVQENASAIVRLKLFTANNCTPATPCNTLGNRDCPDELEVRVESSWPGLGGLSSFYESKSTKVYSLKRNEGGCKGFPSGPGWTLIETAAQSPLVGQQYGPLNSPNVRICESINVSISIQ